MGAMPKTFWCVWLLVIAPVTVWGQAAVQQSESPMPYGSGEQPVPQYAGEFSPSNFFLFGLGAEAAYDDNVLNNNVDRLGSAVYSFSPSLSLGRKWRVSSILFNYSPYVSHYVNVRGLDQLNHSAQFDVTAGVSRHFSIRARNSTTYMNGIFQPGTSEVLVPGLGPPNDQARSVVVPLARQLATNSRLDVIFQKSRRTRFSLFGGYQLQEYLRKAHTPNGLLNMRGWNTGMEYVYQASPRTSLSLVYVLDNQVFQNVSRAIVHTGFVSVARRVSRTVSVDFFAGVQESRLHEQIALTIPFPLGPVTVRAPIFEVNWNPTGGGSITWQSTKTVIRLNAQRSESGGGGLLAATISNVAQVDLRRKLARKWDIIWNASYGYSQALGSQFSGSNVRSQAAGAAIEHSLARGLTTRLNYNYLRQRVHGPSPFAADVDRNRASFGLYYQVGKFPAR